MAQGLADGGAADAETVAEIALHQAVSGQQLEVHDRAPQLVEHDLAQGDGVAVDLEAVVEGQAFHVVRLCLWLSVGKTKEHQRVLHHRVSGNQP
ncbi:hypothetical protein D9M73_231920 [compost metagenome]